MTSVHVMRFAILALALSLSACGGAAWPPASETRSGNLQTANASSRAFINANAVTVGRGDTVYALSRRHRVPMTAIIRANRLSPPYTLVVGQKLVLPRGRQHKVQPGDTLYGLADRYATNPAELARINRIEHPFVIRVGETLLLPDPAPQRVVAATRPPTLVPRGGATRERTTAQEPLRETARLVQPPPRPDKPPVLRPGQFVWPVQGRVSSRFGAKQGGLHNDGINIRAAAGSPVRASKTGVVAYAGNELRGFGNLILVKHGNGWVTAYAHNDRVLVSKGEKVRQGQKIATVGSTGGVRQPQLHFEIRKGRRALDPAKYLPRANAGIGGQPNVASSES